MSVSFFVTYIKIFLLFIIIIFFIYQYIVFMNVQKWGARTILNNCSLILILLEFSYLLAFVASCIFVVCLPPREKESKWSFYCVIKLKLINDIKLIISRKWYKNEQVIYALVSFQIYKMVNEIVCYSRILISNVKTTKLYNLRKPTFNEVGKEIYCKHNKRNEGN